MKIKVSDLPQIRALCTELEMVEEAITKKAYTIGYGYQHISVESKLSERSGNPKLHQDIRHALMEYRKAIIAQLKTFGAAVDETKLEGDHGENEKA